MNIKEALFKIDEFCIVNKIDYVVTGTVALAINGLPANAQDLDIKVFSIDDAKRAKLKELQFLSGFGNAEYKNSKCYTFMVGNVKINALDIDKAHDEKYMVLDEFDKDFGIIRHIKVQLAMNALIDKASLNREKDKTYMLNLISVLASL